jgi:hypothetical protein
VTVTSTERTISPAAVNGRTFDGGHRRSPGAALEVLKAEAMRRELRRAEGEAYRIVLTPPGTSQRTDKPLRRVAGRTDDRGRLSGGPCHSTCVGVDVAQIGPAFRSGCWRRPPSQARSPRLKGS